MGVGPPVQQDVHGIEVPEVKMSQQNHALNTRILDVRMRGEQKQHSHPLHQQMPVSCCEQSAATMAAFALPDYHSSSYPPCGLLVAIKARRLTCGGGVSVRHQSVNQKASQLVRG